MSKNEAIDPEVNATQSIDHLFKERSFVDCQKEYDEQGFIVFENILSEIELNELRTDLNPLLAENVTGRNNFEGVRSNRLYALAGKSPAVAKLIEHPLALAFAEAELGQSCLLSACLAINLLPGESVQPWHYDTGHLQVPRPRAAYGVSAFWALDGTTEVNGATEIIPGSHTWGAEVPRGALQDQHFELQHLEHEDAADRVQGAKKVIMPAGSLMLAKGTLWHRGGANNSKQPRLIVTPQYCPGWARQLENMVISTPPAKVAALSTRLQELIGYSIHPPFMGYADGVHPSRHLPKN